MMARSAYGLVLLTMALVATCTPDHASADDAGNPQPGRTTKQVKTMKIRIEVEGTTLTATLLDNATARDSAALLPLTLTLKDYATNEKISDLPRKLSTVGSPASFDPSTGDITYYAPWGNLALFHKDGSDSPGLIQLGKIDSGVDVLRRRGPLTAKIELAGSDGEPK